MIQLYQVLINSSISYPNWKIEDVQRLFEELRVEWDHAEVEAMAVEVYTDSIQKQKASSNDLSASPNAGRG